MFTVGVLQRDGDRGGQPGGLRRGGAVAVGVDAVAGAQQLVGELRGRLAVAARPLMLLPNRRHTLLLLAYRRDRCTLQ